MKVLCCLPHYSCYRPSVARKNTYVSDEEHGLWYSSSKTRWLRSPSPLQKNSGEYSIRNLRQIPKARILFSPSSRSRKLSKLKEVQNITTTTIIITTREEENDWNWLLKEVTPLFTLSSRFTSLLELCQTSTYASRSSSTSLLVPLRPPELIWAFIYLLLHTYNQTLGQGSKVGGWRMFWGNIPLTDWRTWHRSV